MRRSSGRIAIRTAMILVAAAAVVSWIAALYNHALADRDQERCRIHLQNFAIAVHTGYTGSRGTFPPCTQAGGTLPPGWAR